MDICIEFTERLKYELTKDILVHYSIEMIYIPFPFYAVSSKHRYNAHD